MKIQDKQGTFPCVQSTVQYFVAWRNTKLFEWECKEVFFCND